AYAVDLPGLRLCGHYRGLCRAPAPHRRDLLQFHHGAAVYRGRTVSKPAGHAQRHHRHLPGHFAVLAAGLRCADQQPAAVGEIMDALAPLIASAINAGTPLMLAALGLLVNEKSGVINLGSEGMMLVA